MQLIKMLLLIGSFCSLSTYSMENNGTDVESSDSEVEDGVYSVTQPGNYYVVMNLLFKNTGTKREKTYFAIKVNKKTVLNKKIVIDPSSSESLYVPIILTLNPFDAIEFDFGDNDTIELVQKQIDYVRIPKNSSIKG